MATIIRLLFLVFASLSTLWATAQIPDKPNIIFIMADDLGYGHLGCYGQEKIFTPNIDALATHGMKFTQAYAGSAACAPARSVLLTGYHAGHTPVRANGGGASLRDQDITIAEVLKQNGYVTGIFGKWGLGSEGTEGVPNKQGFDEFYGYLHQLHAQFYYPEFLWYNQEKVYFPENKDLGRDTYSHDLILEKSLDFIKNNQDTSFFCYLPVGIPHHEFIVPNETLALYEGKFPENPIDFWREGYALPKEPKATMAAMITHLDKGVGEIMDLLEELELLENTLVIFTSDNGPATGPLANPDFFKARGGLRGEKFTLYEGGIRVPFIAHWPGTIQKGSTSNHPFYFADMMPTLAELTETSAFLPDDIDGISVLPTLLDKGKQKEPPYLYWEVADYARTSPYGLQPTTLMQAVRMGKWKGVKSSPESKIELYDLDANFKETNDISDNHPNIVKKIQRHMQQNHQLPPPQVDMTHEEAAKLFIPGYK